MKTGNYFTASKIAKTAIFAGLSFILYMFPKFPLPFFPSFLEINFSDVPALLGGFILDPLAAIIIITVKILLKLPFSSTAYAGELADLIIGIAFVLPPSIIYKRNKTLKTALIGIITGAAASIAAAVFANIVIIVPFYVSAFFNGDISVIVNICGKLIPSITAENFFLPYSLFIILPFNLIRCLIAGIITFLLYKKVSNILRKY